MKKREPKYHSKCIVCNKETISIMKTKKYCSKQCAKIVHDKTQRDPMAIFNTYMSKAISKNIEFKLSFNHFWNLKNSSCNYCGETSTPNGIDRIDPKKGYTIENSVPCCKFCNMMKHTYPVDFFLNHVKKITEFNKI